MPRFFASAFSSAVLISRSSTLRRASASCSSKPSTSFRAAGSRSELVNVWPLITTMGVGADGRAVGRAGVGVVVVVEAGGCVPGCGVAVGVGLRVVVGLRFVWPTDTD